MPQGSKQRAFNNTGMHMCVCGHGYRDRLATQIWQVAREREACPQSAGRVGPVPSKVAWQVTRAHVAGEGELWVGPAPSIYGRLREQAALAALAWQIAREREACLGPVPSIHGKLREHVTMR